MIKKPLEINGWEWYKVILDSTEYIVRIQDIPVRYCVIDYYDGRLMTVGSLVKCKKWIAERVVK